MVEEMMKQSADGKSKSSKGKQKVLHVPKVAVDKHIH